jgi:hypothetical protein
MPYEKNFRRLSFSSNIIKIPKSSKRWSIEKKERENIEKKRERKKEKEKLQESLQIKKGKSIFWEEKNTATSKSFLYEPIFFPSIIPFQKPFPKSFGKISQLFLDHPLTWQYTRLELYPLSLPMSSTYLAFRG